MKSKIIKCSGRPVISREHVVKLGDSLFNTDEVDSVKLEIIFRDKSRLSYDSGNKRKAMFETEIDSMLDEDEDD
jgi:hypothetical protein